MGDSRSNRRTAKSNDRSRVVGIGGIFFMINYRVKDLHKTLRKLREEGVRVKGRIEESKFGKFGWIIDPEGNPIELWEPPRKYKASEKEIASQ